MSGYRGIRLSGCQVVWLSDKTGNCFIDFFDPTLLMTSREAGNTNGAIPQTFDAYVGGLGLFSVLLWAEIFWDCRVSLIDLGKAHFLERLPNFF